METTGLSPREGDRVCEVAVLRVKDGKECGSFSTLINPEMPISPGAFYVNGITNAMLRGKPIFSEVAQKILNSLSDAVIVCHNSPFDMGFLEAELERLNLSLPTNPVIDTLFLARRCFRFWSNSLGAIAESLGIPLKTEHRAMADVRTTKEVLERFLDNFHWRGIRTLDEILGLQKAPTRRRFEKNYALPPHLEEAVQAKRPLHLVYVSRDGRKTERVVDPLEITEMNSQLYLVGRCRLRGGEERMFRLDRIISLKSNP